VSRESLDARVLALIGEGVHAKADDARFDALALDLFAHQYEHNEPYRRICDSLGGTPQKIARWRDVPAVPTGAFKEARLAAFPPADEVRVFRSSGTSTDARGELHLDTLALYEASLEATFGAYVCAGDRPRFRVLAPSAADAPDSSLSYMFDHALRRLGDEDSRFCVGANGWDPEQVAVELQGEGEPVALVGTAFAFVHLLDTLAELRLRIELPPGSRAMETGGFKGRSRELTRDQLHGSIETELGVPRARIVNQYGMCELGSQFYEPSLLTGQSTTTKRVPPWVRTRVVDPTTFRDVSAGVRGVLVHYDLANTGSVLAVQTSDAGRMVADGFEVLGRIEGAEARGCSIAADALLAGGAA
jgi:hypothetical protein